jgi:hypothetical protein
MKKKYIDPRQTWSKAIRNRDKKCIICGSEESLNAHHILSYKLWKDIRYDLKNGITLCTKCHAKFGVNGAHETTPWKFYLWIIDNRPDIVKYVRNKLEKRI